MTAEMNEPIGAALLGTCHAHGTSKLKVLCDSPDFEVVGVCEPDAELLQAAKQNAAFSGVRWLEMDELLADEQIRMVAVEGRVRDNLGFARAAIEAGKHVHLDKPAGTSLPEFDALLGLAEARDLVVQMGYQFRYNAGFELCLQAVREGWLGDIFYVHGEINSDIPPDIRVGLTEYRGGMMFELACHLIDILVAILGESHTVTPFLRHDGSADDDLEDNCTAVFQYERAIAVIHTAALEVHAGARRCWEVCGTNGTVIVQPLEPPAVRICLNSPCGGFDAGWQTVAVANIPRYVRDMAELAECIRGECQPSYAPAHDLATQRAVLAACGAQSEQA